MEFPKEHLAASDKVQVFGYLDESSTNHRFFGIGLLISGPATFREDKELNESIRRLKVSHGIHLRGDVSWKKLPTKDGKYLDCYREIIEGFFASPRLQFHAIVVDTAKYPLDSAEFFRGSKDAGMDGFSFHLIHHKLIKKFKALPIYLRVDRRSRRLDVPITKLRQRIVSASLKEGGVPALHRLRSVEGGRHPLVQVADLLLGCVTSSLNGKTSKYGKVVIRNLVEKRLGRVCHAPTVPWETKFSVWHFKAVPKGDSVGRVTTQ